MTAPFFELLRFKLSTINKTLFNTSTIRRRNFDAQIVSMHNAGSHWLKYSLSVGAALVYKLEQPQHIQCDRIIGHPKAPPDFVPDMPKVVHSHSLPNILQYKLLTGILDFPRYVVLVRRLEDALFSAYVKWQQDFPGVGFIDFVHSGPFGSGPVGGLWHEVIFYNAWGAYAESQPENCLIVRYEDLKQDWEKWYTRIWDFLGFAPISADQLNMVKQLSSKEEMAKKPNPQNDKTVVRLDERQLKDILTEEEIEFLNLEIQKYVRYPMGYWEKYSQS